MPLDGLKQAFSGAFGQQQRGGACSHGEEKQPTQSKGKGQRRTATKNVLSSRSENVFRKGVTNGQQVAVEMNGGLGLAGCSGTESNKRNIVLRSYNVIEFGGVVCEERWNLGAVPIFVQNDFLKPWRTALRLDELLCKLFFAQRVLDPGLGENRNQFLRADE